MIYLLSFAGSTVLTALAERQRKKYWLFFFSVLALWIPGLLAGFRSIDVGRDVSHYVKPMVDAAVGADNFRVYLNSTWQSSIGVLCISDFECGFTALVYVIARLTGSLQITLFVIAALIMVPVYIALMRNRGKMPVWLGMLVFYLLFYNGTLNLMRQWIAMAFLLLAFQMFCEKKYVLAVILSVITVLFHYSAAMIILIFCVYGFLWFFRDVEYSTKIKGKTYSLPGQLVASVLLALLALLTVSYIDRVFAVFSALGIDRFKDYLTGQVWHFSLREFLLRLPLLVLFVWHGKRFFAHTPMAPFYFTMLLLDIAVSQLTSVNSYAYRIPLFFSMFTVFSLPQLYAGLKTNKQKWIMTGIAVFYLLSYWGYLHTKLLLHNTYPYQWFLSQIVGFPI